MKVKCSGTTNYDWIVVGGGVAGIGAAEILSRGGVDVLLLERNASLASETTKVFHEWLHTGALYTLVPDGLLTTRYLLGAIDDLLLYYSSFSRNNLVPTDRGITVRDPGWFNNDNIKFKYRNRSFNFAWKYIINRSARAVNSIKTHDWLRRRGGEIFQGRSEIFNLTAPSDLLEVGDFLEIESPDLTMNSRAILSDLVATLESRSVNIITNTNVFKIRNYKRGVRVETSEGSFSAKNILLACSDGISRFTDARIKTSYAPMIVVDGLSAASSSFVELDYYQKNCINLLRKPNNIGLAGGISLDSEREIAAYLEYCEFMHRKRNPGIRSLGAYIGLKKELVSKGEDRNYLYHIKQHDSNVWSVVLGKFTLIFSMAPELYRRIYKVNPPVALSPAVAYNGDRHSLISKTSWQEISGV